MKQKIVAYHKEDEDPWVAQLVGWHFQHVRRDPAWTNRTWVTDQEGRDSMRGFELNCKKSEQGAERGHKPV